MFALNFNTSGNSVNQIHSINKKSEGSMQIFSFINKKFGLGNELQEDIAEGLCRFFEVRQLRTSILSCTLCNILESDFMRILIFSMSLSK